MVSLFLALAGCAASGGGIEVEVDDSYFEVAGQPATKNGNATAKVGEAFEFKNDGAIDHTVTVHRPPDPGTQFLKDDVVQPGASTSFTFDKAGTYHIWCKYHGQLTSGMHLTVTVS